MFSAIDEGNIDKVNELLKENYGADGPDWGDIKMDTPLHRAVTTRHIDIVATLLNAGANINRIGRNGSTPVYLAAHYGRIKILELLIERGARLMKRDDVGTFMHFAAKTGFDIVAFLLKRGE